MTALKFVINTIADDSPNSRVPSYGLSTKLSRKQAERASRRLAELRQTYEADASDNRGQVPT